MASTNEKMNITGFVLTGLSLFPALPPVTLHPVATFMITGVISFIGASLFMNKGSKWIINILAQKEPTAFALGLATSTLSWQFMTMYPFAPGWKSLVVLLGFLSGITLITVSIVARYTSYLDL